MKIKCRYCGEPIKKSSIMGVRKEIWFHEISAVRDHVARPTRRFELVNRWRSK